MPSLSFKKRFGDAVKAGLAVRAAGREPFVDERVKLQTIRANGKRRYRAGDSLHMFTGMRQVGCERLGVAECRSVQQIRIQPGKRLIEIQQGTSLMPLFDDEATELAHADGFDSLDEFFTFFAEEAASTGNTTFCGQLIKW